MYDKFRAKVFMLSVMEKAELDTYTYIKDLKKEFGIEELKGIKILAKNI